MIVPTGIATDEAANEFFVHLVNENLITHLYDFENRAGLFRDIDSRYRFSLLVFGVKNRAETFKAAFLLAGVDDISGAGRECQISKEDFALINPNSRTCPVVKSEAELTLLRACYRAHPILIQENPYRNEWHAKPTFMFQMSDEDGLFARLDEVTLSCRDHDVRGAVAGSDELFIRLYEAKLIHQFDHRFATFQGQSVEQCNAGDARELLASEKAPDLFVITRFFMPERVFRSKMKSRPNHSSWLVGYREIARPNDVRTLIAAVIPKVAAGRKIPQIYLQQAADRTACLVATLNCFLVDWIARCKLSSTSISNTLLVQLPVPDPAFFDRACDHGTLRDWISKRVLELMYTAWDLQGFAQDLDYIGPPFRWDDKRRFLIRCELDALCFHLYCISRDDASYILDTFPIVRRKDEQQYSEYRTKRVILEIYDAMAGSERSGIAYQTCLNPPPADPRVAHAAELAV